MLDPKDPQNGAFVRNLLFVIDQETASENIRLNHLDSRNAPERFRECLGFIGIPFQLGNTDAQPPRDVVDVVDLMGHLTFD